MFWAKPSPVVRLFSLTVPKAELQIRVDVDGDVRDCNDPPESAVTAINPPEVPAAPGCADPVDVPLESLAWGRSGDKGNKANIGIIARHSDFVPYIAAAMTEARVAAFFRHFLAPGASVQRFYMPGPNAFNFLLDAVLGGGGIASLRSDPQGKAYAQLLLTETVQIPWALAESHGLR